MSTVTVPPTGTGGYVGVNATATGTSPPIVTVTGGASQMSLKGERGMSVLGLVVFCIGGLVVL